MVLAHPSKLQLKPISTMNQTLNISNQHQFLIKEDKSAKQQIQPF